MVGAYEKNTKPTENPSDIVTTKDVTTACTTKTDINTTKGTNIPWILNIFFKLKSAV